MNKINWHLPAIFFIPLLVYLFSMPLTVALEDDGLFIMSSYFNGVSHPPGYPLHSLIGKLFTFIPISTVAARVHAVSSVFGALSCVMLWLIIHDLLNNKLIAYTGALSFAFSTTFWSQSIIAEVYTLNAFFFFSLLYLLITINRQPVDKTNDKSNRLIYLSAFVFGLSLCNHWPLMVLSSLCLLILLWPGIKRSPAILYKSIPFILIGLLPYAWMVINSLSSPVISFTGPIDSWHEFINFIARTRYAVVDVSSSADITDKIEFLFFYLHELSRQFSYLGFLFVVIGLFAQFKYLARIVIYSLLFGFLGNSLLLIVLLDFDYELINRSVISVYFIVSYGIASLWLSVGLYHCYVLLTGNARSVSNALLTVICLICITVVFGSNFSSNYRHNYNWGQRYASTVLKSVPRDAVLMLSDDINVGTIGYMHLVESIRPDVKLLSEKSVVFTDRLYDPSLLTYKEAGPIIDNYIRNETRPLHTTSIDTVTYQNDYWLTRSLSRNTPKGQHVVHANSLDKPYLRYILAHKSNDPWSRFHRKQLLNAAVPFVVETKLRGDSDAALDKAIEITMQDLDSTLTLIHYLKARGVLNIMGGLETLLSHAESLYLASTEKIPRADYLRFRALINREQGDMKKFEHYLVGSIQEWPNEGNISFDMLAQLYSSSGRKNEYNALLKRFDKSIVEKFLLQQ